MAPDFSKLGVLKRASVKNSTLATYEKHFNLFWCFVEEQKLPCSEIAENLDVCCEKYCDHIYMTNDFKSRASVAVAALEFYYDFKLPKARRAVKSLLKLKPPVKKPALPWRLTLFLICQVLKRGDFEFAVATLLMFAGFLRIGEMNQLKISDVQLPKEENKEEAIVLTVERTKTYQGAAVYIRREPFRTLVLHFLPVQFQLRHNSTPQSSGKDLKLFSFSDEVYRKLFKYYLDEVGLGGLGFLPHSLRHGAASHARLLGDSIDSIMEQGRWQSESSARVYIQNVGALYNDSRIPQRIKQRSEVLAESPLESMLMALQMFNESVVGERKRECSEDVSGVGVV